MQEGERSYGINSVLLIEVGRHPEGLLRTDAWSIVSSQRINNKLLVDIHSFGLGFVSHCVDARFCLALCGCKVASESISFSLHGSSLRDEKSEGIPARLLARVTFPFPTCRIGQCLLVEQMGKIGKETVSTCPRFHTPGVTLNMRLSIHDS